MQLFIKFENYKGGINNLTVVNVIKGYSIVKTFSSKVRNKAVKRAEQYISESQNAEI